MRKCLEKAKFEVAPWLSTPGPSDRICRLSRPDKNYRVRPLCFIAAVAAALLLSPAEAQQPAGDAAAAKGKISMCVGCHGIPGYKTAFPEVYHVPLIAGQQPEYIVKALQAYKSGERSHPSMRGIAESLSEQDMADLAAYYGGKK
jgi:cytochrome c553